MNNSKVIALTEWFNIFGELVGLPHVRELGEFVSGHHLPSVMTFMKEKVIPNKPSEKIKSRREFFENLLHHLSDLQKLSPNQFHTELNATAASYGQSDEIAKFLAITLFEIRMNPDLQVAAFDVILPKLSVHNRAELEDLMDYLDDCSQWPSSNRWSDILKKPASTENRGRSRPITPTTPKCSRIPFRDMNKTVPNRPLGSYNNVGDVSLLNDSPKLRENRQRRHIQEQQNEIKKLKSELNEMSHEMDQLRLTKNESKSAYEQALCQNKKLIENLREKESEKAVLEEQLESLEVKLNCLHQRDEENDVRFKELRQLKLKNQELRGELNGMEDRNMQLVDRNQKIEEELEELSSRNRQLEKEAIDLRAEASSFREKFTYLDRSLKDRDEFIENLQMELQTEKQEHERCRSQLQNRILDSEENTRLMDNENLELVMLRSRMEGYISRAAESEKNEATLRNKLSETELSLNAARLKIMDYDAVKSRIPVLEAQQSFYDSQVNTLQNQLQESIDYQSKRETEFKAMDEKFVMLQTQLADKDAQLNEYAELKEKYRTLENEMVSQVERDSKRISELEMQLNDLAARDSETRKDNAPQEAQLPLPVPVFKTFEPNDEDVLLEFTDIENARMDSFCLSATDSRVLQM